MDISLAAPLYTLALFAVCFALSAFVFLTFGDPFQKKEEPKEKPKPKPRRLPKRKLYLLTDVFPENRECGDEFDGYAIRKPNERPSGRGRINR